MNIIMIVCVLIMSLFLVVAMLSCGTLPEEGLLGEETEEPEGTEEPVDVVIGEPVVADPEEPVVVVVIADPNEPVVVGEPPVHKVIDGILERGSRVEVTNTIVNGTDKRLPIRKPAGIKSPIIGSAANGATGTILSRPVLGDGGAWWEIAWDDNGKVAFNEGDNCCIGWSAETNFDQNIRYLTEIR